MSYWETSERNNFAAKALELLRLRQAPAIAEHDIDCTLVLAALTMLLCNTKDSVVAAVRCERDRFGAQSISESLRTAYSAKLADVAQLKSLARSVRVSSWKKQEVAPQPRSLASEVRSLSQDMTVGGLIGALRNAVAHGSVEWTKDGKDQITGALFVSSEHAKPDCPQRWRAFQLEMPAICAVIEWWARQLMSSPASPSEHSTAIELEFHESAMAA